MNKIQEHAEASDAAAIEKCRQDPKLAREEAEGDLCIPCMMPHPCICDWHETIPKMRAYYEANRRGLLKQEPVLDMSWGQKGDGLMDGLYRIAREPYQKEIARLNKKLASK